MEVTTIQHLKKYIVTVNQETNQVKVTVNNGIENKNNVVINQLGKRGFQGISAYDIAVKNGFIGTESQWLLSLVPTVERRVFNETPIGVMNGANIYFTSANNFIPETVTVFLNGIFQRIIIDFHTVGNNSIVLTDSPGITENILINYTKL